MKYCVSEYLYMQNYKEEKRKTPVMCVRNKEMILESVLYHILMIKKIKYFISFNA
jgi:hypothetical protein